MLHRHEDWRLLLVDYTNLGYSNGFLISRFCTMEDVEGTVVNDDGDDGRLADIRSGVEQRRVSTSGDTVRSSLRFYHRFLAFLLAEKIRCA